MLKNPSTYVVCLKIEKVLLDKEGNITTVETIEECESELVNLETAIEIYNKGLLPGEYDYDEDDLPRLP